MGHLFSLSYKPDRKCLARCRVFIVIRQRENGGDMKEAEAFCDHDWTVMRAQKGMNWVCKRCGKRHDLQLGLAKETEQLVARFEDVGLLLH